VVAWTWAAEWLRGVGRLSGGDDVSGSCVLCGGGVRQLSSCGGWCVVGVEVAYVVDGVSGA